MMSMTTTTPWAIQDIDFQSTIGLISMTNFPPLRPGRGTGTPIFEFLVQFELHREIEQNVDRLAVERAGPETPLSDCFDGRLVEAERQWFEHVHVDHFAGLVDGALQDDDAGDAGL